MAGVLKVICPTAKAKFCPSGCFAAATAQWNWQGAKRLWDGLSPSKPIMGNCDEAVRVGEGVNLIVASPVCRRRKSCRLHRLHPAPFRNEQRDGFGGFAQRVGVDIFVEAVHRRAAGAEAEARNVVV